MGVQGLWHLLQPCARPTQLETLEGKRLAIDSSIWLYHFQMAMRDKEGRTLTNAHILGFLWRILKLIHYGIRPIFVFDGGAPVLKRATLAGRSKRKRGARDDVRRVAERLLHARMREAALAHVGGGASGSGSKNQEVAEGEHGLGNDTVYMDDLAGATSASAAIDRAADALDDGGLTRNSGREKGKETEEQARRKRDKYQEKDPYALPALDREIHTLTAENSAAAHTSRRGGGKRPDIRFATEGELRSLLSSIQPTDLDLDSEFFRSLPTEMQYELVGDLRAASRGTSYKRLQAMLAASPRPIDFSRAQIAGLKTRNELTQKVLEVTDEIGDAHIKVPIRVAGARNREYVLIRNKSGQAGFTLGVRETGETQEHAIAVDEETATDTTDDEFDKRSTDDDILLEDVDVTETSPQKAAMPHVPDEIMSANPNDPMARKKVAQELLQRRARELAKEKAKELGIVDEREIMEEEIKQMRALRRNDNGRFGSSSGVQSRNNLFRSEGFNLDRIGASGSEDEDYEADEDQSATEKESQIALDEQDDLTRALVESAKEYGSIHVEVSDDEEEEEEGHIELDVVDTNGVDADDYSAFYGKVSPSKSITSRPSDFARVTPPPRDTTPTRQMIRGSGLGFRLSDREGYPERLNPNLLRKIRSEDKETQASLSDEEQTVQNTGPSIVSISDSDLSDMEPSMRKPTKPPSKTTTKRKESRSGDLSGNAIKIVDYQDVLEQEQAAQPAGKSFSKLSPAKKANVSASIGNGKVKEVQRAAPVVRADLPLEEPATPSDPVKRTGGAVSVASQSSASPHPSSIGTPEPVAVVEVAELPAHTSQGETAQESPKDDLPAPSSPPGIAVRREASRSASPLMDLAELPEFDDLVSMAEKEGSFSDIRAGGDDIQAEQAHSENEGDGLLYSPDWSRSPTPADEVVLGPDGFPLPTEAELEAMEAEDEAELGEITGDQDEFVSFLSRAKNRGLHEVRQEVEDEVNKLRSEQATTRRAEGDVTLQMAKEIQLMLRLFGLPYITAPMEAEAQCAELVTIGLADGIITDDSDVFLFGGTFVYKNMFNPKKFVECYKLSDLQHDLGMDRTKLVQLAYLLGSDYTDGLEGVGPVLAMEILSNFIGDDGLIKFRDWWMKVQKGQDTPRDTCNTTLKRIKRTLRNKVHMAESDNWPDENVLNAYYEPDVDSSDEAFQWGLPDLDSLRSFFQEYLTWDREKTDHYLIPTIEAQNRRSRRTQSTLDNGNFFDLTAGQGVHAAREKRGYHSARLQKVVTNFRASKKAAAQKQARGGGTEQEPLALSDEDAGEDAILEPLVGKEMAKRSRPIVTKRKQAELVSQESEEAPQAGVTDEDAAPSGIVKKGKKTRKKAVGEEGRTPRKTPRKKATKKKRNTDDKDDAADDGELFDDVEWRPRAAKPKKRKTGPQSDAPTTMRLAQARTMNLDQVDALPPSRAPSMRPEMSASTSRESLVRGEHDAVVISEDDSSDLSDV